LENNVEIAKFNLQSGKLEQENLPPTVGLF